MRHAFLGAGGVGGLVGACLARVGERVSFIVRPGTISHYPRHLHLESAFGNCTVDVDLCTTAPPDADVLWITVKATQLESALASLGGGGNAAAVPLLNGIDHVALLRSRYGAERVIPATIAVETEAISPGHILHRSPFARLNISSRGLDLLGTAVGQLQQLGFTCNFVDDEPTLLWSKLVFLAPLALTTTAAAKTTSEIQADPELWSELQTAVHEACTVAKLESAKVDADAIVSTIANLPPGMRSSMQKDVEQGRTPELDAIGGAIVRAAGRHGVKVPVVESLIAKIVGRRGR